MFAFLCTFLALVIALRFLFYHTPNSWKPTLPFDARNAPGGVWGHDISDEEVQDVINRVKEVGNMQPKYATEEESSNCLRNILQDQLLLKHTDTLRHSSRDLFLVHREGCSYLEGGFGVRVTVQFNLFGGCIANLGSPEQLDHLADIYSRGQLGCFMLTEVGAGVLSGLIVETTATWNQDGFVIETPTATSKKTWISQGMVADWGVVIARLILPGDRDMGPHAFLVDMKTDGIKCENMPRKTDFNSLDNATITFDRVQVPLDSLLTGISYVDDQGEYHLVDPNEEFSFIVVAQRLLSGRIAIAGASLGYIKEIIDRVEEYGDTREIPVAANRKIPLSELPIMADLLEEVRAQWLVLYRYVISLESEYMAAETFSPDLVHRIACAKIECNAYAIQTLFRIKQAVGSLALFDHGPFGSKNDILYVLRFAEGDSAILQQKMVKDLVKSIASPQGLLLETFKMVRHLVMNTNGIGVQKSYLSFKLLHLAFTMSGISGREERVNRWLECHPMITTIAEQCSKITIYDQVYEEMAGTREFYQFKTSYLH